MTALRTVPGTITPDAAERLAELGMHAECERMLEHARQTVPGLRAIRVVMRPVYDTHEDTGITIEAVVDKTYRPEDQPWKQWEDWFYTSFPPQVWEHFDMCPVYETGHAG
ncbi:MAG TPA: hypothetical protein VNK04_02635 [Gemmataceae bacterium]|nr:hypothetical protein [Gemmataceae bacterium]